MYFKNIAKISYAIYVFLRVCIWYADIRSIVVNSFVTAGHIGPNRLYNNTILKLGLYKIIVISQMESKNQYLNSDFVDAILTKLAVVSFDNQIAKKYTLIAYL